ncbi:MAG: DUF937 domain-containing protein [Planctomycetota bacterium]
MDLVKSIMDQLSGDNLNRLSELLGSSPGTTERAAEAAVPSLFSGLASLASSDDGAKKLSSALGGLDLGKLGGLGSMLSGDPGAIAHKGNSLLASLFGDSMISNVAGAVGRFAGMDTSTVKKFLAYLLPLILGRVGAAWQSAGGTPRALQGLLADQKSNAAAALPSGFSLADIPGMAAFDSAARAGDRTVRTAGATSTRASTLARDSTSSLLSWLIPLAALLLVGLGLWYYFGRDRAAPVVARDATEAPADRTAETPTEPGEPSGTTVTAMRPVTPPEPPAVLDVAAATSELSEALSSAGQALKGIDDAASANAAVPRLTEVNTKIESLRDMYDRLPPAGQTALAEAIDKQFGPIKEEATRIMAMPGASEEVKSTLQGITSKLAGLNIAQVSQSAQETLNSLTKTLNGFQDAASADAALPQLKEVSNKLADLERIQDEMPPSGRSMLASMVSAARGPLEQLITKVLTSLGADAEAVKPVLDEIVNRLNEMTRPSA